MDWRLSCLFACSFSPPSFSTCFLFWSPSFSISICLVCLYRIAGLGILPSSAGFSPVAGFFVLGRRESWSWSRSSFHTHVEAGIGRVGFVTHRWTGNGLDQGKGVGHRDTMSILGKYLIILIDQPQRVSSTKDLPVEWLDPGAPRTSTKIKKLPMSIEERERERVREETKQWGKAKENK